MSCGEDSSLDCTNSIDHFVRICRRDGRTAIGTITALSARFRIERRWAKEIVASHPAFADTMGAAAAMHDEAIEAADQVAIHFLQEEVNRLEEVICDLNVALVSARSERDRWLRRMQLLERRLATVAAALELRDG